MMGMRVEMRDWVFVELKPGGDWQFLRVDANCWTLLAGMNELWANGRGGLKLPEEPKLALRGNIYYHPELRDGTPVLTTQIVELIAPIDSTYCLAITAGDAQYELVR